VDLSRFVTAQDTGAYTDALQELRAGRKTSHWMWFVFPQVAGLGRSSMAKLYAVADLAEAAAYLDHEVLGARLRACCLALLELPTDDPVAVFGEVDAMKLRSSMTLFAQVEPWFTGVLDKYFGGAVDFATLELL
jgi:uncharacterized protein (DUF1810 family)